MRAEDRAAVSRLIDGDPTFVVEPAEMTGVRAIEIVGLAKELDPGLRMGLSSGAHDFIENDTHSQVTSEVGVWGWLSLKRLGVTWGIEALGNPPDVASGANI